MLAQAGAEACCLDKPSLAVVEPVQLASLCFQCCHLHVHSSADDLQLEKNWPELFPIAFVTLSWTADG